VTPRRSSAAARFDTARRSQLAPAFAHHCSRGHSRRFWGMRLHLLAAPDGTPERRSSPRHKRSATSRFACSRSGCTAASWWSATRATPAATSNRPPASASARRSCARRPRPSRGPGPAASWIRQLLDARRPPRPRPPPRPHAPRTTGADRRPTPRARRLTPHRGINQAPPRWGWVASDSADCLAGF
jgi:hypothetical protein